MSAPRRTDRQDLVEHFSKERNIYSGPRPAQGIGIADRPPAPSWQESLARYLSGALSLRPSLRWECAWGGAPVDELNKVINHLCDKGILVQQRHQTLGHAAFWTLARGMNWNPENIKKEIENA